MTMQENTLHLETIRVDRPRPGIVVATLNRPDRMNAMTRTMFREFEVLADALNSEDDLRVVIITGEGRAFCAGFDLDAAEDLASMTPMAFLDQQELAARGLLAIGSPRVPVIAAVNGAAAGGGLSLALAADIRLGSPQARFNAAFVRIGLSAGDLGASWMLCLLYTSDAADERSSVDLGGRRIIKKKKTDAYAITRWHHNTLSTNIDQHTTYK